MEGLGSPRVNEGSALLFLPCLFAVFKNSRHFPFRPPTDRQCVRTSLERSLLALPFPPPVVRAVDSLGRVPAAPSLSGHDCHRI